MLDRFLKKLVAYLDPKLERFRPPKKPIKPPVPKSLPEFIDLIRNTPKAVLSNKDRQKISAVMGFEDKTVRDLMIRKHDLVFVHEKDFLGPLTLDRLYKSGFLHFPVIDRDNHVKGIIHTASLNALEIKKTDRAESFLDKDVKYLRSNDSLLTAVTNIKQTGSFYFLVLDDKDELAGFFTLEMLLNYLLGL